MNLAIGADHAGFEYKEKIKVFLEGKGYSVKDYGCYSEERADYPDHAHPVAEGVENGTFDLGIVICGSGNGINMTVNKHQGIRSALCWNTELAALARAHNDANIIAIPARFINYDVAEACVDTFLKTVFEGGRHLNRVNKISCS